MFPFRVDCVEDSISAGSETSLFSGKKSARMAAMEMRLFWAFFHGCNSFRGHGRCFLQPSVPVCGPLFCCSVWHCVHTAAQASCPDAGGTSFMFASYGAFLLMVVILPLGMDAAFCSFAAAGLHCFCLRHNSARCILPVRT